MNTKPPDYDQSLGLPHRAAQVNPQMQYNLQFNQGMYQPTFPMNNLQNTALFSSDSGFNQMQLMRTSNIPSREQTKNEKKERMRQQLSKRKIPEDLWNYYLEAPEHWDFEDTTKEGLQRGIEAILMSPNTVTPCWVEKESVNKFVNLKMKLTAVTQATAEIIDL